ncbi:uncharacterized protein LOC124147788 isoform X2 [Haliotis rufescens]|uniref:uncharacterized protein LOC124147788 isoform X2 n=1 Tax=Haliotis rufescens TaxID=6454 RepID=UPI00201EBD3E|nr:uncharacterized protein LOC124147788 isoform X2 [Haliotis rufescens]
MKYTTQLEALLPCVMMTLVLKVSVTTCTVANVTCNGSSHVEQFYQVYSRSIVYNGSQIVHMGKDGILAAVPNTTVRVEDVYKIDENIITATIRVNCTEVTQIQCEVFGLKRNYRNTTFVNLQYRYSPAIEFHVEPTTPIRKDPAQDIHQVLTSITVYCEAVEGSKAHVWQWEMKNSTQEIHWLSIKDGVSESQPRLVSCAYHTTSQLTYLPTVEGQLHFRCFLGNIEVGNVHTEVLDLKGTFSFHLFLTSILFVYIQFIIIPLVWTCFPKGLKKIRRPERTDIRILRSCVSFLWSIAFFVYWIVLCYDYGRHPLANGYVAFAAIETSILLTYAVLRSVVVYIRKPEKRHLYNARVALSYGAVLCPCICWTILRVQSDTEVSKTEIVFWVIAAPSLVLSIYVSHDREGKDWEKED